MLIGVIVWNKRNEIELFPDSAKTLKNFVEYRQNNLLKYHLNDNAQLLTKQQFDGGVIGQFNYQL